MNHATVSAFPENTLHGALELSKKSWVLGFGDNGRDGHGCQSASSIDPRIASSKNVTEDALGRARLGSDRSC